MNTFKVFYLLSFWSLFLGLPVSYVIGSTEAVGSTAAGHLSGSSGKRSTDVSEQRTTVKDIQGNTGGGTTATTSAAEGGKGGAGGGGANGTGVAAAAGATEVGKGGAGGGGAGGAGKEKQAGKQVQNEDSFSVFQLKVITTMGILASVM
ncbi:hypothetical protein BgAZ_207330 [Babesia gibsoni]|uniref:Uncharacterized protein n=1 Tax=Babesia gibsoni TaxID=33632 RepID=A0AAD8PEG7_BABGI|nr:hypothetical protein BgAZ_207330 [Babesia gibsoni]